MNDDDEPTVAPDAPVVLNPASAVASIHPAAMHHPGPVIVFDTDCVLCSGMVRFVLARERDSALRFAGAWSEEGLALAARHGFTRDDLNATFLVVEGGRALTRSDAAFAILGHLRAPWRWLGPARIVPRPLRDGIYDLVARHRYRVFGRMQDCTVVPPAERHRFLGVKGGAGKSVQP